MTSIDWSYIEKGTQIRILNTNGADWLTKGEVYQVVRVSNRIGILFLNVSAPESDGRWATSDIGDFKIEEDTIITILDRLDKKIEDYEKRCSNL